MAEAKSGRAVAEIYNAPADGLERFLKNPLEISRMLHHFLGCPPGTEYCEYEPDTEDDCARCWSRWINKMKEAK